MKSMFKGIVHSVLIAFACYFIIYGIRASGILSSFPSLNSLLMNLTNREIFLFSLFAGLLYFAARFLSKTLVSILAACFIFIAIFWAKERIPGFWEAVTGFWDNLMAVFKS